MRIVFATRTRTPAASAALLAAVAAFAPAVADEPADALARTLAEIEGVFGRVPGFLEHFPDAALPGAWDELKAIELQDGALDVRTKALIALAVAAQIPCQYCIWEDTNAARQAGATDAQIEEAVLVAALERHWSTFLNGMQVDLDQFKHDLGGE
ncbi:MAG: carboxymuconolactone decarboxylase family protein [Alphaproteobacteria bacterium]